MSVLTQTDQFWLGTYSELRRARPELARVIDEAATVAARGLLNLGAYPVAGAGAQAQLFANVTRSIFLAAVAAGEEGSDE